MPTPVQDSDAQAAVPPTASAGVPVPGPVRDADTALRIGLRAIEGRFGPAVMERYRPYEATLGRGEWLVAGNPDPEGKYATLRENAGPDTFVLVRGSAPWATISPEDGRVLASGLGR